MTNRFIICGPGGTRCCCCFPAPGSQARRLAFRTAKRRERAEAFRLEAMAYDDATCVAAPPDDPRREIAAPVGPLTAR